MTEKQVTFYIDKKDGIVSLYIKNREVCNHLADGKSRVVGEMTAAILNAVEWLTNGESLSVTIKEEKHERTNR